MYSASIFEHLLVCRLSARFFKTLTLEVSAIPPGSWKLLE